MRRAIVTAVLLSLAAAGLPSAASGAVTLEGRVQGAGALPVPFRVTLFEAESGAPRPVVLGSTTTRRNGSFSLRYRRPGTFGSVRYLTAARPGGAAEAGYAVPVSSYRLATVLGTGALPPRATLNERTTVAAAYAMAQFFDGGRLVGEHPGLGNAAAMAGNLVRRGDGGLAPVLRTFPNGRSTATLATFNSLADLTALCRRPRPRCAQLLRLAGTPGGDPAADTLAALVSIARNPWHNAPGLFRLSRSAPQLYRPALDGGEQPDAWTLALRFEGAPETMNGPGNFAIDAQGSLWVLNNYEYSRNLKAGPCGSEKLLRFTPTGQAFPGSPYEGGGVSGAGFGITFDPRGRLWLGNFGFAARGCERTPPSNSVSLFSADGEALSPDASGSSGGGFTAGEISWPQGTVSDRAGNIWIANCGNDSVTRYANGVPAPNTNLGSVGLQRPFGIAVNAAGGAFVASNGNSSVVVLGPDGKPTAASPITGSGLDRPLGIAVDSRGYVWVANSAKIVPPCKGGSLTIEGGPQQGSVTLLEPDGTPARPRAIEGAGMLTPWGVAIDGDDTVWVANFSGQRLSQLCGTRPRLCPPGRRRTGASISPPRTGYGFDGLVRNTGVAIDPSGNVWLTNNWKRAAFQTNPGGYQIVAYLGLAEPIETPLIGPPQRP